MHEVNVYAREGKHGRTHWQYDFRVELPDGKVYRERRKARGANTEAAARRIGEARMLQVIREGQRSAKKDARAAPTVAEFAAEWLALGRSERQSPCTLKSRRVMLDKHILPVLGDRRLDTLDEKALLSLRNHLAEHKSSTVNLIVRSLMAMLRCAERLGHKVRLPKVKPLAEVRQRHWYTPHQYEALVASATTFGPDHLVTILLGGDAGLRSGEITALHWEDVDFEMDTLFVRRNFADGEERAPKCSKTREVPLSNRLRAALLVLRRSSGPTGHVLVRSDGQPWDGALELDNGAVERAIRGVAIGPRRRRPELGCLRPRARRAAVDRRHPRRTDATREPRPGARGHLSTRQHKRQREPA